MIAVPHRAAPAGDVARLVRLRRRTDRLLAWRTLGQPLFWGVLSRDERRRLVAWSLFACFLEYRALGLVSEWRRRVGEDGGP